MKKLILVVLFLTSSLFSQSLDKISEARPEIGWDSLKSLIMYPEIARRAGVEDESRVYVSLDADGKVIEVDFAGYGIFASSVKSLITKIKWLPEIFNGKPRASQLVFDIKFQLKGIRKFPQRRVLTIEAENSDFKK
jgi:hypothetical protein